MPQNWEEKLNSEFNWNEVFGKNSSAQKAIVAFIKRIRQQDMEELIKINGYAEYEDRLKMIKEYYKQ